MNILYTFNDKFVPQVAAAITSVCENNKNVFEIHFYLMSLNVSQENEKKLTAYIQKYGREVSFIELGDMSEHFDFEINTSGWNPIVLARLLLDKLLPSSLDRILYLDGDTIVRGSLEELYQTEMKDHAIAASLEPTYDHERKASIGMKGMPYYNAGVLLIDLNNWRSQNLGKKIISFYKEHEGKLFSNDQDAINGTCKGQILTLSPKYNYYNIFDQYSYRFLSKLCDYPYIDKDVFEEARKHPVIIHYLGEERPWRKGNHHRFKDDYDNYLNMTPWKGMNYEDGWNTYFMAWDTFNVLTKPFPSLRYHIINALIPAFLNYRAKKVKK